MTITSGYLDKNVPRRLSVSSKGIRTATYTYFFASDDPEDTEFDVLLHPNCPKYGWTHPGNPFMWAQSIEVENHEPYSGWRATVTYSNEGEINEDPTLDPAKISWSSEQFQKPLVFDRNGDSVLNSAGDPFDPPHMIDDSRESVTIVKNVSEVPTWILAYKDAVNNDTFIIDGISVGIGQAKIQRRDISEVQYRNDIPYRQLTLVMHIDAAGWKAQPLDAGFREIVPGFVYDARQLIKLTNEDGETEYPPAPVPLDGSGAKLDEPTPATAVYLEFDAYPELPFSALATLFT